MEANIGGYPQIHTDYLTIKKDLDRLKDLLDQTKVRYQNALNKAEYIPFTKRVSRFFVPLLENHPFHQLQHKSTSNLTTLLM